MAVRTFVLTAPIGDFRPVISRSDVEAALAPESSASLVRVDLGPEFTDGSPASWQLAIERCASAVREFDGGADPGAIFAMAPIPVLVALGRLVGDKRSIMVFDRHRHRAANSWAWDDNESTTTDWRIEAARSPPVATDVAVVLSISGEVDLAQVQGALTVAHPLYELRITDPRPNVVRTCDQLRSFGEKWRELLGRIRATHGTNVKIHLFPAVPLSVAIECGRRLLPKVDPPIRVYDVTQGKFRYALTVGERGAWRAVEATTSEGADLLVLVALEEEFEQMRSLLPHSSEHVADAEHGGIDFFCQIPSPAGPLRVVLKLVGAMGTGDAQLAADRAMSRWSPSVAVWLGIAGGVHRDVRLCDVIVADQIDAYDANLKAVDTGDDSYQFEQRGAVFHGDHSLVEAVKTLKYTHGELFAAWQSEGQRDLEGEVRTTYRNRLRGMLGSQPVVRVGHVASGSVVGAAAAFVRQLQDRDASILALEMESAGLARAAVKRRESIRYLVLRGISDTSNADKALLDKVGKGAFRRVAMRNATRLLLLLIQAGILSPRT
jgi:nucleoside phosphorylase